MKQSSFNRSAPFGFDRFVRSTVSTTRTTTISRLASVAWTPGKDSKTVAPGWSGNLFQPSQHVRRPGFRHRKRPDGSVSLRHQPRGLDHLWHRLPDGLNSPKLGPLVTNPNAPWSGQAISTNNPNPRTYQWMLSVERQISSTLAWEGSYVGNHGADFIYLRDQNHVDHVSTDSVLFRAFFQDFTYGMTPSPAITIPFRQRCASASRALSASISTIHSRVIFPWRRRHPLNRTASPRTSNNIRAERGLTQFDTRQRFNADAVCDFPRSGG